MPTATVTSKGQITIPIEVRKALKLKAGDKINFFRGEDGNYTFEPKTGSLKDMLGILSHLGYALGYTPTVEQMDQAILDGVSADYLRSIGESEQSKEVKKAS
jgi:AbrB family looped-hinge helix DNA binding protein